MRVLIIEDEKPAAKRLSTLLSQCDREIIILDQLDTVRKAVAWFGQHPAPDLIFMDIQLADGLSFDIFSKVPVVSPIIFTTAYDQYAIQAFKVNSIDYLLKPIDPEALAGALKKFKSLHHTATLRTPAQSVDQMQRVIQMLTQPYKNRFVVKVGEHIKAVPTEKVLYFYSQEKMTFMQTSEEKKRYIIDYPLDQLEDLLDPRLFFRISRKYIVKLQAIQDIITYSSSRLKLKLLHSEDPEVLVSRERVSDFKQWLDQ